MQTIDLSPVEWRTLDEQPLLPADYEHPPPKFPSAAIYLLAILYAGCFLVAAGGDLAFVGCGILILATPLMILRPGKHIDLTFRSLR